MLSHSSFKWCQTHFCELCYQRYQSLTPLEKEIEKNNFLKGIRHDKKN